MHRFIISEGGSIALTEGQLDIVRRLKSSNQSLPFMIDEERITFADYTVGEMRVGNISIMLAPRNAAFTIKTYFEIINYLNELDSDIHSDVLDNGEEIYFNLDSLASSFLRIVGSLVQFGLTGRHVSSMVRDLKIVGEIDASEFIEELIPFYGISQSSTEYSLNTTENQLIKAALYKLSTLSDRISGSHSNLSRYFEGIDDVFFFNRSEIHFNAKSFTTNPWYPTATDMARKILFDLFAFSSNGSIESVSFLSNSNDVFERYVRKVLQEGLTSMVEKWSSPKDYAILRQKEHQIGRKGFSPDILIEYSQLREEALAVLDVKNKTFEPGDAKNPGELVSNSDLYQLYFYCKILKAKVGGLVFPSSSRNPPIELYIRDGSITKMLLFSLNMSEPLKVRNKHLVEDLEHYLIRAI